MIKTNSNYKCYSPSVFKNSENKICTKFRIQDTILNEKGTKTYATFIVRGDLGLYDKQWVTILKIDSITIGMNKKQKIITIFGIVAPLNN